MYMLGKRRSADIQLKLNVLMKAAGGKKNST